MTHLVRRAFAANVLLLFWGDCGLYRHLPQNRGLTLFDAPDGRYEEKDHHIEQDYKEVEQQIRAAPYPNALRDSRGQIREEYKQRADDELHHEEQPANCIAPDDKQYHRK